MYDINTAKLNGTMIQFYKIKQANRYNKFKFHI